MRTPKWFGKTASVPRSALVTAVLIGAVLQVAGSSTWGYDDVAGDWLKLDQNGEPSQVTLSDGTALKLDTYGDDFEAYEYRAPLTGDKATFVFGADRGPDVGWTDLAIDTKHQKSYWVEGTSKVTHIMSGRLTGAGAHPLMDFSDLSPANPTPDAEHGKLYWYTRGLPDGSERAIYQADLNGKNPKPIIRGLADFNGFAIDTKNEHIYYFDSRRLIRTDADGTGETAILEDNGGPLAIDHDGGKLYWSDLANTIRRANLDGTDREDIVNTGSGHIYTIALDRENNKLYWHNSNYHNICRSNLDGSGQETVVAGIIGTTDRIAIDTARTQIYWAATNHKQRGRSVGLWRVKCPAPPRATTRPAPPYVTDVKPHEAAPGDKVHLIGGYLNDAAEVMLLDDGDGSNKPCKFAVEANGDLTFIVPRGSKSSHHPLIVVRTPGGVTVTLPQSVSTTGRGGQNAFDRFHPNDKFAQLVLGGGTVGVERAAVVAMRGAVVQSGPHGENTYFLRDGAIGDVKQYPDKTVFFEPSASIIGIDKPAPRNRLVPVPAIRPSFVDPAFRYSNSNNE